MRQVSLNLSFGIKDSWSSKARLRVSKTDQQILILIPRFSGTGDGCANVFDERASDLVCI